MLKILIATVFILSCSTTPTGRTQLKLIPESQLAKMGSQSFNQLKSKRKLSSNKQYNQKINCITNRLLLAMGEKPKNWKIEVFEDSSPNAFALPGKNMGVHTGMIKLAQNNAQLAAVIGHEIGHVKADHGNERLSQSTLLQGAAVAGSIALTGNSKKDLYLMAGMGLATYGVMMPFSRTHESEADRLGLEYMANAGFNPYEAAALWKVMKKKAGKSPPEFLSTHPSPETRVKKLTKLAPKFMAAYKENKNQKECI